MTDFETSWNIIRPRFEDAVAGLSQEQLNWRLHPESLTIGEMALHVAGAEINFVSQLLCSNLDPFEAKLRAASTDGVVNDKPFPYGENEITPELVEEALARAKAFAGPTISNPSEAVLAKQIVSVLGPMIDGRGALARLSFHPGYHQGQAHLIKTAPGFPG